MATPLAPYNNTNTLPHRGVFVLEPILIFVYYRVILTKEVSIILKIFNYIPTTIKNYQNY